MAEQEMLVAFLTWLDHHTDTFDPVMINMARERGQRHLRPEHVESLVRTFMGEACDEFAWSGDDASSPDLACDTCGIPQRFHEEDERGTGPNAYPTILRDTSGRAVDVG